MIIVQYYILLLVLFSHLVMSDSVVTPWTVACQILLSVAFPWQEH